MISCPEDRGTRSKIKLGKMGEIKENVYSNCKTKIPTWQVHLL